SRLMVRYQPLWPESVPEKKLSCAQQPGICVFRALWNVRGQKAQAAPPVNAADEGGFESLVALFARRDANTRCVRRLFNALASTAKQRGVDVSVFGIKASEVHRGSLASWDVLLTVASNYYNRKYPTLVPLLHPAGNQNLSGGQAVSEAPGKVLLSSYESSIVYPPPAWLGAAVDSPQTRADSLRLLEEDVARNGPAPIYPLAF